MVQISQVLMYEMYALVCQLINKVSGFIAIRIMDSWINRTRILGAGGDPNYTDPDTQIQRGDPQYSKHDTTDKHFSSAFNSGIITGAVDEEDMWRELSDYVNMIFKI